MTKRLESVWLGNDKDLLSVIIPMYLGREPARIIDVTWGSGRWWRDYSIVLGLDKFAPAPVRGDYCYLPLRDSVADVIVFDPPHRSSGGEANSSLAMRSLYGDVGDRPEGLLGALEPALREARRVLTPGGIVLAKIADQVHWHRSIWHQVGMVTAALSVGLTACDMIIKTRRSGLVSSRWKRSYHALKRHAFWLVFRNGGCEPLRCSHD